MEDGMGDGVGDGAEEGVEYSGRGSVGVRGEGVKAGAGGGGDGAARRGGLSSPPPSVSVCSNPSTSNVGAAVTFSPQNAVAFSAVSVASRSAAATALASEDWLKDNSARRSTEPQVTESKQKSGARSREVVAE
jgi:hypothetical protein